MNKQKTIIGTLIFIGIFIVCNAQPELGFYYQAAIRDATGNLLNEEEVSLRISLRETTADGVVAYREIHTLTTSPNGIVNLFISEGENATGVYADLTWGLTTYFIELEVDLTNTGSYTSMGATQILSVPLAHHALYANYATEAGNVNNSDTSATNELQSLYYTNDSLKLTGKTGGVAFDTGVWKNNGNTTYLPNRTATLGISESFDNGSPDEFKTMLTIRNTGDSILYEGTRIGIQSKFNAVSLGGYACIDSRLSYMRVSPSYGEIAGIRNIVSTLTVLNCNLPLGTAYSAGTSNKIQLNNLRYETRTANYFVAGVHGEIEGAVADYPDHTIIAGVYGNDQVNTDSTYAGYFAGKVYVQDSLAIGRKNPQRPLHIKDVMRLEPRATEPGNPSKGDIYFDDILNTLRVWDGSAWRNCF